MDIPAGHSQAALAAPGLLGRMVIDPVRNATGPIGVNLRAGMANAADPKRWILSTAGIGTIHVVEPAVLQDRVFEPRPAVQGHDEEIRAMCPDLGVEFLQDPPG